MQSPIALLSNLFDTLPLGIVVLDAAGRVVVFNRTEERLAGRRRERVIGRDFFVEIAPCMNVQRLGGEFAAKIGRAPLDVDVEFSFPFPFNEEPRDVRVKMSSFEALDEPYAFLLIEDVSIARSVERMKETLQSLLVHDLKNPLSAILANLGFLGSLPILNGQVDAGEAIADSVEAGERIQRMLLNLLDITRLETNSLVLDRTDVDVAALLVDVARGNAALAKMRGVEIDVDSGPVRASIDEALIRRALDNLVDNALRHAKKVTLSASRAGADLVLEVRDDGPGVPERLRQLIFDKYAQVQGSGAESPHNRGLGLTFVRLAARAHGGDVSVACPPGSGSTFCLTLRG